MLWELGKVKKKDSFIGMIAQTQHIPNYILTLTLPHAFIHCFLKRNYKVLSICQALDYIDDRTMNKINLCSRNLQPSSSNISPYSVSYLNCHLYNPLLSTENLKIIFDCFSFMFSWTPNLSMLPLFSLFTLPQSNISYLLILYNNRSLSLNMGARSCPSQYLHYYQNSPDVVPALTQK